MKELGIRLNQAPISETNSLKSVVDFLRSKKFNPEKEFFHFEINPKINPVTAENIKSLISFPFEITLTESNGHIFIETGKEQETHGGPEYMQRRNYSRLSMHTHPIVKDGVLPSDTLSLPDIYVSEYASKETPLILASQSGIIHYRKPTFNPITNELFRGEARDILLTYCEHYGIDVFNFFNASYPLQKKLKSFNDLSRDEKRKFLRKFSEETGMIISEALWGDTEKIAKLLAIINLKLEKK